MTGVGCGATVTDKVQVVITPPGEVEVSTSDWAPAMLQLTIVDGPVVLDKDPPADTDQP